MAKKTTTVMEKAMSEKYPYTTEDLSRELRMKLNFFRVWKSKLESTKKIARPAVNSLLCIQDPTSKNRLLYSEEYLNRLQKLRDEMPRRNRDKDALAKVASLKTALMTVTVSIHDENVLSFVRSKFKDEAGLEKHLKDHIYDLAKPALSKIEELKKKHRQELEEAMMNL